MSIIADLINEASRVLTARNVIRYKLIDLGLAKETDDLSVMADGINAIENHSGEHSTVKAGSTFTIPEGYHDGTSTVDGLGGDGSTGNLQVGRVSADAAEQVVVPEEGYDGFSAVIVAPVDQTKYVFASDLLARLATI